MDQEPWDIYEGRYPHSALCLTLTSTTAPAALNLKGSFKWLWSSFTLFNPIHPISLHSAALLVESPPFSFPKPTSGRPLS
ncbi:hypothetical protein PTI98_006519 [Pleurotus ostreatus]|nr:hypothetical protein PTI98_006519 [Pleurotus ostreatus]